MSKLHSLELYDNRLTSEGLMAILDNCTHLELLITRNCPNLNGDGALLAKCARVKIVTLREMTIHTIRSTTDDYYDYSRYLYGVYVTDFDDDENSNMLSKSQPACCHAECLLHSNSPNTFLRLSAGQCQAFWTDDADDDLLGFLAKEAPSLMSLRLISCGGVSNEGLVASIKNFPLLEELELSLCADVHDNVVQIMSTPQAPEAYQEKTTLVPWYDATVDEREARAIATMKELRSLELYRNRLTRNELKAILDSCTRLNLLIVQDCPNLTMDDSLLARLESYFNNLLVDGFFPEELQDYEDYSSYLNEVHVTQFDDDEDCRMLSKRLRRYLK
ncbi:hypothetical protein EJB05_44289, partial [Eragrostis curvula]